MAEILKRNYKLVCYYALGWIDSLYRYLYHSTSRKLTKSLFGICPYVCRTLDRSYHLCTGSEIIGIDGRIQEHVANKLKSFKGWKNNSDSCLKISQRRHCLNKYGRKNSC